jgi:hypothetical protein
MIANLRWDPSVGCGNRSAPPDRPVLSFVDNIQSMVTCQPPSGPSSAAGSEDPGHGSGCRRRCRPARLRARPGWFQLDFIRPPHYYSGKYTYIAPSFHAVAERGARRGKPQPIFQATLPRPPAVSWNRWQAATAGGFVRVGPPGLSGSVWSGLAAVRWFVERVVAACRGGHPAPPDIGLTCTGLDICRSNEKGLGFPLVPRYNCY